MKYLSMGNSKLAKDGIACFSLPAVKTCPFAAECKKICYACKGMYRFPSVKAKRERNYKLTQSKRFLAVMDAEVKACKAKIIRIHDSGDFYSRQYAAEWIEIIRNNPDKLFYCYTKSACFIWADWPSNFILIMSVGGVNDKDIDQARDVHAQVFVSKDALLGAGYFYGNDSDLAVIKYIQSGGIKVGLVKH